MPNVVECFVEEHVMACGVTQWTDGEQKWSVEHDSNQGITHLGTTGELPESFIPIRDRLTAKQSETRGTKDEADFVFDIPIELAKSLTGFRYDDDIPGTTDDDEPFEILEAVEGQPLANWNPRRGGCLGGVLLLSLLGIGGPVFVIVFAFVVSALFRWLFS